MPKLTLQEQVAYSLAEDVGSGDVTARLLGADTHATAVVVSREVGVLCGVDWFTEVCRQVDENLQVSWLLHDGDALLPERVVVSVTGLARSLVTAERCALNWLQTLSGTATITRRYVDLMGDTSTVLLDTRKTLPLMRDAQKYAVRCGGGENHRMGLYDRYLIKENHIASCGSIAAAIAQARQLDAELLVEIEVENLAELQEALAAMPDIVMLDNFSLPDITAAVEIAQGAVKLEVSGNVDETTLPLLAQTGVDYISVGAITKHVQAVDFSMRLQPVD